MNAAGNTPQPWVDTEATVTSCRFQFAGLGNMAFGFSTHKKFRITFDYYAHGKLHSDEFQSDNAIPQNTPIPLSYNPLDPAENSLSHHGSANASRSTRPPLLAVGLAGSVVLSLLWLLVLHGCNPAAH